jgi:hypothetical protein
VRSQRSGVPANPQDGLFGDRLRRSRQHARAYENRAERTRPRLNGAGATAPSAEIGPQAPPRTRLRPRKRPAFAGLSTRSGRQDLNLRPPGPQPPRTGVAEGWPQYLYGFVVGQVLWVALSLFRELFRKGRRHYACGPFRLHPPEASRIGMVDDCAEIQCSRGAPPSSPSPVPPFSLPMTRTLNRCRQARHPRHLCAADAIRHCWAR